MGLVFLGQSASGRPVAVKVIRPDLAADSELRARFRREVAAAQQVSGPFMAEVVDADAAGPHPWLAMAYVAGPSLAEVVREYGPLPLSSLMTLAAGLAAGLCATQAAGLVHGELKPANVLLAEDGPRMIGFGNSPAAEGGELGPSSDVFRLGLVLAFAATGHGPFRTGKPAALADRVVHGSPDLDRVPDEIRSLVERCLAQDPGQRPTPAGLVAEIGPARPGADWLPASITRSIAGYMLPAPAEMAWPDKSRMAPQVAALASATRPDLPATPASAESEAGQAAVAKTKPSAGRTLLTAGAVAVAAAVAVTLSWSPSRDTLANLRPPRGQLIPPSLTAHRGRPRRLFIWRHGRPGSGSAKLTPSQPSPARPPPSAWQRTPAAACTPIPPAGGQGPSGSPAVP